MHDHQLGRYCEQLCSSRAASKIISAKRKAFLLNEPAEDRRKRLIERYERRVIRNGEQFCWDWSGHNSHGYGAMKFDGKALKAHRVSWEIHNGKIPENLCVLHRCDVKICTRPSHLFLGTLEDNIKDMIKKGRDRSPVGSKVYRSVLNEEKVGKIKTLLKKGMRPASIASEYKVSKSAIEHIKYGRCWKAVNSS